CTIGAAGLYIAEASWLRTVKPDDALAMTLLLVGLWIVLLLPNFFHRPSDDVGRWFHGALVLVNFAGVMVVGGLLREWLHLPRTGVVVSLLGLFYTAKAVLGRKHEWRFA